MRNDYISRQAAIEAVRIFYADEYALVDSIEEQLEKLPSVQPEIIRCRECKWCVDLNHDGDYSCLTPYGYRHIDRLDWYCADAES